MILLEPYMVKAILIFYIAIAINAVYLALKYEKGYMKILWSLVSIFVPVIGSALYLIQFQINKKELRGIKN
ncbi:PLDc N-terminal domain-containing protein [Mesonia sp.]|uniref:PLDc N-terminal domain-containing protein n=1 Tax=Mesonia sp. TaxID=1960830 RepID=UPI0017629322|nr:PLDc N-terminal domain-containing protein [Mesonia sp.]HIB37360.1 hypothetical protein [Mesonia sp.]HIO27056.1 hypothetical protein [Flavobacteriaceae bacterium]